MNVTILMGLPGSPEEQGFPLDFLFNHTIFISQDPVWSFLRRQRTAWLGVHRGRQLNIYKEELDKYHTDHPCYCDLLGDCDSNFWEST